MKKRFFLQVILVLLILSIPTRAQWIQTNGPDGGGVCSFATLGTNLFAGTSGGIFLSTNNGSSWSAVNTGLTSAGVWTLAVSGTDLFAGTSSGVFLSSNNGTSWNPSGLTNTYLNR